MSEQEPRLNPDALEAFFDDGPYRQLAVIGAAGMGAAVATMVAAVKMAEETITADTVFAADVGRYQGLMVGLGALLAVQDGQPAEHYVDAYRRARAWLDECEAMGKLMRDSGMFDGIEERSRRPGKVDDLEEIRAWLRERGEEPRP